MGFGIFGPGLVAAQHEQHPYPGIFEYPGGDKAVASVIPPPAEYCGRLKPGDAFDHQLGRARPGVLHHLKIGHAALGGALLYLFHLGGRNSGHNRSPRYFI